MLNHSKETEELQKTKKILSTIIDVFHPISTLNYLHIEKIVPIYQKNSDLVVIIPN